MSAQIIDFEQKRREREARNKQELDRIIRELAEYHICISFRLSDLEPWTKSAKESEMPEGQE